MRSMYTMNLYVVLKMAKCVQIRCYRQEIREGMVRTIVRNPNQEFRVHVNVICNEFILKSSVICDKHWRETI